MSPDKRGYDVGTRGCGWCLGHTLGFGGQTTPTTFEAVRANNWSKGRKHEHYRTPLWCSQDHRFYLHNGFISSSFSVIGTLRLWLHICVIRPHVIANLIFPYISHWRWVWRALPSLTIPTARHFWKRQNWQRFLLLLSTGQSLLARHTYFAFFCTVRCQVREKKQLLWANMK